MIKAIVRNGRNQISLCVANFSLVNGKPLQKCILHHIFGIGLAAQQIISYAVQKRLIKSDRLSLVQSVKLDFANLTAKSVNSNR